MRAASLFIEPDSLSSFTSKLGLLPPTAEENKNYWSSLSGTESQYSWMREVQECVARLTRVRITIPASQHLEAVMERFVTTQLVNTVPLLEKSQADFGENLVAGWLGRPVTELDGASLDLAQELQLTFLRQLEQDASHDQLLRNLTCVVLVRFLEAVTTATRESTPIDPVITLFYCLYVERTSSLFSFLSVGYVETDLIPEQPNLAGITLNRLRLGLADYFKQAYNRVPLFENGVLTLLAGSSNVIQLSEAELRLASSLLTTLAKPFDGNEKSLFLILHRFLLYLTFAEVETRLAEVEEPKVWSVAIVLDALNTTIKAYRQLLQRI